METTGNIAEDRWLARVGLAIADWCERWFPDPFIFALLGIFFTFIVGLVIGIKPIELAIQGGKGFWVLIPFTMQMVMTIVGGYVVASTPLIYGLIKRMAKVPKTSRAAIGMVAFFSLITSMISWAMSLIFSGLLIREIVRERPEVDIRAIGAAGYLGLGSIWALGISSSAALLMASQSSIPPALLKLSGIIPLTHTIFLPQNIAMATIILVTSLSIAIFSAPSLENARTSEYYGIKYEKLSLEIPPRRKPGEWLEYSPLLSYGVSILIIIYLWDLFQSSPQGVLAALDLNVYNLIFITAGLILHRNPRSFLNAVYCAIPVTGGVIIQFPFYGIIFGMITGTGISHCISNLLVSITTKGTYPLIVAIYSALLGIFVPSGGSKWIIEAPYIIQAANTHKINLGWVVQIYNASEALPNLINPFWMLPLLGLLKIRARELVGYSILQLLFLTPLVFFLCWFFAQFIPYIPPAN